MINLGAVPANSTLYIPFESDNSSGASVTITGLATSDIKIYKNGSTTERSSTAGFTLLDTDGIDFDSLTGIHGFSIDLSDNTDASFYAVGSWYWVVVSTITVDSQTKSFIAAVFRIVAAESVAGKPKVDVDAWLGTAAATPTTAGVPEVDVTHWLGTAAATPTVAGVPEVDITHAGGTAITVASGIPEVKVASIAANAITATAIADGAIDAGAIAADAITAAKIAADAIAEIQNGLATSSALSSLLTTALSESYAANGSPASAAQLLYAVHQMLMAFAIGGTTISVKQLDGTTQAFAVTLDDATSPTSAIRS